MTIFHDPTDSMPAYNEHIGSAMCREDTTNSCNPGPTPPKMSGEQHWPERNITHVSRPRRGHGY